MNPETLTRLMNQESRVSSAEDALTIPELFETLEKSIFLELDQVPEPTASFSVRKPFVSTVRRNLQRAFVGELIQMALERDEKMPWSAQHPQVARTQAWHSLKRLRKRLDTAVDALGAKLDAYSLAHWDETRTRVAKALDAAYTVGAQGR
jgi:hypothetical protein